MGIAGSAVAGSVGGSAIYHAVHDDPADAAPPVTAEIGPDVERYAEMSPFLRQQLRDLRADGWTIGYGPIDDLGSTRPATKTIVINESVQNDPLTATSILAHEVGHAYPGQFDPAPEPPRADEDYNSWLERNMQLRRLSEAESELVAAQVRWEILDDGGPDIGRVGDDAVALYLGVDADILSRDEAREQMTENLDWYSFDDYRSEYEKLWDKYFAATNGPSVEQPEPTG